MRVDYITFTSEEEYKKICADLSARGFRWVGDIAPTFAEIRQNCPHNCRSWAVSFAFNPFFNRHEVAYQSAAFYRRLAKFANIYEVKRGQKNG